MTEEQKQAEMLALINEQEGKGAQSDELIDQIIAQRKAYQHDYKSLLKKFAGPKR